MKCDIIIPVWNQLELTKDCIESIIKNTQYPYKFILIDNASDNDTKRYLESLMSQRSLEIELIRNEENLGFVKAVNQGLKASRAPYVCIMNNDTVTTAGWLDRLIEFAESHRDVGLANPLCGGPADIPMEGYARSIAKDKDKYMEMNQCFGFCMLVKREVIQRIGYLDEAFGMGSYDDTDYSMRAGRAGYRCVSVHSSYVHHIHSISFKALGDQDGIVAKCEQEYFKKWPMHRRIGVGFLSDGNVGRSQIENLLKAMLFLAREWFWINLWILGKELENKRKIKDISREIKMPCHQNIKFNYISSFKDIQVLARVVERSFGTKRRKKYDAVLTNDKKVFSLLSICYPLHKTKVSFIEFASSGMEDMASLVSSLRAKDG